MIKQRITETDEGIQNELDVEIFDQFARVMRDKGWNNVDSIIQSGITGGTVLEIGPGPGYIGLEWLKKSSGVAKLTGCEISPAMILMAQKNADEYGLSGRTSYVEGNCMEMPFPDASFDAVFSNGSLHEWEDPVRVFNEIGRIVKPGGRYCISDMRRDVNPLIKWLIYFTTKPKEIRPGYLTSLGAAYTASELENLLRSSALSGAVVSREFFGLSITGSIRE